MRETEAPSLGDQIEPMPGRIVVLVDTKDEITANGLLVPQDVARSLHEGNRPTHGTIVAMAQGSDDDLDDNLELGDHVLFSKFSGTKVSRMVMVEDPLDSRKRQRAEETVIIMNRSDVLARIKTPEAASGLKIRS